MGSRRFVALAAVAAALALTGCVQTPPTPSPAKPTTSVTATGTPSATPSAAPTLAPGGTAQQNLAYFDLVNARLFASNGGANGRTIIDSLVAAGFTKADMQVTPDKTSINGNVDSILFSVRFGEQCLIGQHGGGGYSSTVQAALAGGTCIVGRTRAITW
jgi:hypothetical protein